MKQNKGGKRVGAGRKKTGRKTEVISFSVPKEMVEEIRGMVKEKLAKKFIDEVMEEKATAMRQSQIDIANFGVSMNETTATSIRRVDPNSEEGIALQQLAIYEAELSTVPETGLGIKRRRFIQSKISELKKQLK